MTDFSADTLPRNAYIGGSDAGAILGVSPWSTPVQVFYHKTGVVAPDDISDKPAVRWGHLLEDLVAQEYARVTGNTVREKPDFLQHPQYPFLCGHIDREVNEGEGILECKTTSARSGRDWGDPLDPEAQIPPYYLAQVLHYLNLLPDAKWCDVAVLIGGSDFRVYRVDRVRYATRMEELLQAEVAFWGRVQRDDPPEPRTDDDVKLRWPVAAEGETLTVDDDVLASIACIKELEAQVGPLLLDIEQRKFDLKTLLKTAGQAVDGAGTVVATYSTSTRTSYDTKQLVRQYPDIAKHLLIETSYRTLRIK